MMRYIPKVFVSLVICLLSFSMFAVVCSVVSTWNRVFGRAGYEVGYDIQQVQGGFLAVGASPAGTLENHDLLLMKITAEGIQEWGRLFGGDGNDQGHAVVEMNDTTSMVVGQSDSYTKDDLDLLLLNVTRSGEFLWMETYGGNGDDVGNDVIQTRDGNVLTVGSFTPIANREDTTDLWLLKTTPTGNVVWSQTYGGRGSETGYSILKTPSHDFVVSGASDSFGLEMELWLLKVDAQGEEIWNRTYQKTGCIVGHKVLSTMTGDLFIIGSAFDEETGGYDLCVIKTDEDGHLIWMRSLDIDGRDEVGYSGVVVTGGDVVVTGKSRSPQQEEEKLFIVAFDEWGDELWRRLYNGMNGGAGFAIDRAQGHGFVLTGITHVEEGDDDLWILKTDEYGFAPSETQSFPLEFD